MCLKAYMDIFSHSFKIVTPRALMQCLLFIVLSYLTNVTFIANLLMLTPNSIAIQNWHHMYLITYTKMCRVATNLGNMENLENSENLKNFQSLRENSGKFEHLQKKPGKFRKNEKYVT